MCPRKVEILGKEIVFDFKPIRFRVESVRLRHEKMDGSLSPVITRLNLDRGDGAAAILYDRVAKTVILVEQFRYSTYENGDGWLLQLPAGIINPDENPAETMRREAQEETGYQVEKLELVSTFYPTPGGSSERIFLYWGYVSPSQQLSAGGGLASEHEDIRLHILPVAEAWHKIETGEIRDAKTIIGLQWLHVRQLALAGDDG